jgi:hypothetical protein
MWSSGFVGTIALIRHPPHIARKAVGDRFHAPETTKK